MDMSTYLRVLVGRGRRRRQHRHAPRNGAPTMRVGDVVRLVIPDNPRLDNTQAVVLKLTEWGAHCVAPAAASGTFRALWTEMKLLRASDPPTQSSSYTGEFCVACGSSRVRRVGNCKVCDDCGESGGCD